MLEPVEPAQLAGRLGITDDEGVPHLGGIANWARRCVAAWRRPARQRLTLFLHSQLFALGFDEEIVRKQVRTVIDGLLEISDLTSVRLDGRTSIVQALPTRVAISGDEEVLLGRHAGHEVVSAVFTGAIARHVSVSAEANRSGQHVNFEEWLGSPAFLHHVERHTGAASDVPLAGFWVLLQASLDREGAPIDRHRVRALVHPPGHGNGFYGHHAKPGPEGRWSAEIPAGTWCAVRPGRNASEWHPIIVSAEENGCRALDLYDWDEWTWALLARGAAVGQPERMSVTGALLQFEHPIPRQFIRALRLLGGAGPRPWSWEMSEAALGRFQNFYGKLA